MLGREYFEFVALRRLAPAAARKMRKEHRLRVLFAGFAIVLFAMVPPLNLLLPLFGAVFMVHVFERLRQQPKSYDAGEFAFYSTITKLNWNSGWNLSFTQTLPKGRQDVW